MKLQQVNLFFGVLIAITYIAWKGSAKKINDIHFLFLIMTFLRRWWQLPYFWAGIKVYDIVSGDKCLKSSFIMSKERALEMFPMLKRDKLKGKKVIFSFKTRP